MTDIIALIDEGTDDEMDRAEKVAASEALIRAKDIGCWCANEPRIDLCPSCGAYGYGLYVGVLASIVAARLGVEVVDVRREALMAVTDEEVIREGVTEHVETWLAENRPSGLRLAIGFRCWYSATFGCSFNATVTRIEWRYLHPFGRCFFGPEGCSEPYVEWDDGKERPVRLIPDHLRAPYEAATS